MVEGLLRGKLNGAKHVIVLGIGNESRGDDAAGMELAGRISKRLHSPRKIRVVEGGASPENFTSAIRNFKPSHLIVIDAAQMGLPPGSVRILERNELSGFAFSTHNLPLSFLIDYLQRDSNVKIIVIGIEPLKAEMGEPISEPVMKGLIYLEGALLRVLRSILQLDTGRRR